MEGVIQEGLWKLFRNLDLKMEKLNFLIDGLNGAAHKYHVEHRGTGIEVKFRRNVTKVVYGNDLEVEITIWVKYRYHGFVIEKLILKKADRIKNFGKNKRSIEEYHAHADLISMCCQDLINTMVLATGDWSIRKIISGDAVINPFIKSPEPYYGMTFKDIIRYEVGSIHKENTKQEKHGSTEKT